MKRIKELKISNVLLGIFIGALITMVCCIAYSKIKESKRESNYLAGGWVLTMTEQENADPDKPRSLNFSEKTVTITTIGGDKIECNYSLNSDNDMDYTLIIYDYPGIGDIEFSYVSLQPLLHIKNIKNSETILDGEYLFAG